MKNKIFWLFSIVVSIILCSCEEKDGPGVAPVTWKIESADGAAEAQVVSSYKDVIYDDVVYCGPEGGSVCLKNLWHSYIAIYPDHSSEYYKYNNSGSAVAFKNEWCEARVDGCFLYIDFKPFATDVKLKDKIAVTDYGLSYGPSFVHLYRLPSAEDERRGR